MAYSITAKPLDISRLTYLPLKGNLKSGEDVIFGEYNSDMHEKEVFDIFHYAIEEGTSYPQETIDIEGFRRYYTSSNVFVCTRASNAEVLGAFYVKPNFPDRSSHICNAGFIVNLNCRGQGLGKLLTKWFLYVGRDLGYEASFFNLVYETNKAARHLYDELGFQLIGVIPKAGKLKNMGYVDAHQYYYDLTTVKGTPF